MDVNVLFHVAAVREGAAAAAATAGEAGVARMEAAMIGGLRFQTPHGDRIDLPAGKAFASEAEATRARMVVRMDMLMTIGSRVGGR